VIVFHVAITAADDYATRREGHRQAHIGRLEGLRGQGLCIGGGPAPDGRSADVFYRLSDPAQLRSVVEDDPYWRGGVWTEYHPRSFREFVEPWEAVPLVLDGSRRVTIVEGPALDADMAQFALIELRGAGRLAFGGFLGSGATLALLRTADPGQALGWLGATGFWDTGLLSARPLLRVL
jgi:uncharacterized protein YciI